jgi:hypothetical protein
MRVPISVHSDPFDIEKVQPEIDAARQAFANYLDQAPKKSTKSKYGLMGTVGKILAEIKSGRRDPESLKGYAIRVHELQDKHSRPPSDETLAHLERGIDTLTRLMAPKTVPVAFQDAVLDRLDYGLYYELRKRQAAAKEERRQAWITYLRDKYKSDEGLAQAWGEQSVTFRSVYLPKSSEGSRAKQASAKQIDIADFWQMQGVAQTTEGDDEE